MLTRLEETLRRIAALEAAGAPFAEIAEQLSRLYAQKDASGEALTARLEAVARDLDRRLAAVEEGGGREEEAARAEAQAIATQLIAMRAAAAQTELFADRIALLEASLPRLSVTQSLMMQALERQAGVAPAAAGPAAEVRRRRLPPTRWRRSATCRGSFRCTRSETGDSAFGGKGLDGMERIWNAYGGTPAGNRGLTNSAEARRGTRRDGGS